MEDQQKVLVYKFLIFNKNILFCKYIILTFIDPITEHISKEEVPDS